MNSDLFICPKCRSIFVRNEHYLSILEAQNFINLVMSNKRIVNLCGSCNYFEYEK